MQHGAHAVLTDVAVVAPAARDEDAVPKAVRNPEELTDNPGGCNAENTVEEGNKEERACEGQKRQQGARDQTGEGRAPRAEMLSELKDGTILENMRQGIVMFWYTSAVGLARFAR